MRWKLAAVGIGLLGIQACSGGAETVTAADSGEIDAGPSDAVLAEGRADGRGEDAPVFDTVPDTVGQDATGVCVEPGGFGCPCQSGKDCNSGICVQHMGDLVCTEPCVEECPGDGWTCKEYSGVGDPIFICLSDSANLCWPCASDSDCKANGSNDVCVSYAAEGSFCGSDCDAQGGCPSGYECKDVTTVAGLGVKQCVSASGTCLCTALATTEQAWTPCSVGNELGTCPGKRVCGDAGLAVCDAQVPSEEVCNGVDDDCDGQVDGDLCDDGDLCTTDSCAGKDGCVHANAEDGIECADGDLCTLGDHCDAGKCIGKPLECADGKECTLDQCDPASGECVFPPDDALEGAACGLADKCSTGGMCVNGDCLGLKPVNCMDGVLCTLSDCDPQVGCLYTLDHAVCDDGNPCTDDVCQPVCDEPGICVEGDGCVHVPVPDGMPCPADPPGTVLACAAGKCECVPQCDGKVCGENGCGGSCGTCEFPKVVCWQDGESCIGAPCLESAECEPGLYCDKTQDPAQCLPGCDSDVQCIAVCPVAASHACLPSNQCVCALGGWPGTAYEPGPDECLAAGPGFCLTADRYESMAAGPAGSVSASGKYRIESTLWE